ncbi:C39 family peptidase [Hyalangium gracile]|uniref:C39 family peptidase n=1 Tax=Hyalangium gracile TaxID=394092 RepID=UPI001CC922B0|nr:C39 family peptidase [Hyalangium gracile]
MQPIRDVSQRNACLADDPEGAASRTTTAYVVQKGDTLSKIAAGLQRQGLVGSTAELVRRILTLNPQIKDPNRIEKGDTLQLPAVPAQAPQRQAESKHNRLEGYFVRFPMTPAYLPPLLAEKSGPSFSAGLAAMTGKAPAPAPAASFLRTDGKPFPTSQDGTPRYKQRDMDAGGNWGDRYLGDKAAEPKRIADKGCALTSVAMALSKLSGETITPGVLDAFLDTHDGYVGNSLKWATAGQATQSPISVTKTTTWNLDAIDKELDAGRPVVLAVDYKVGSSGGNVGTDHWVCLTRRGTDGVYFANDPATGAEIRFQKQSDGQLQQINESGGSPPKPYRSSGEFATFSKAVQS